MPIRLYDHAVDIVINSRNCFWNAALLLITQSTVCPCRCSAASWAYVWKYLPIRYLWYWMAPPLLYKITAPFQNKSTQQQYIVCNWSSRCRLCREWQWLSLKRGFFLIHEAWWSNIGLEVCLNRASCLFQYSFGYKNAQDCSTGRKVKGNDAGELIEYY